jgi:hypothetical protein
MSRTPRCIEARFVWHAVLLSKHDKVLFNLFIASARRAFSQSEYAGVIPQPHQQVLVTAGFSVVRCGHDEAPSPAYHCALAVENTLGLMSVNTLSFRTSTENGLSFELLVDGQSLASLIGAGDSEIPYWLVEDDLPYFPPFGEERNLAKRIVTVCSCGEYGCGHAQCDFSRKDGVVEFSKFDWDVSAVGSTKVFRFSASNYEDVVKQIVALAKAHSANEPSQETPTK